MTIKPIDPAALVPKGIDWGKTGAGPSGGGSALVNVLVFDGLYTKLGQEELPVRDGRLDISGCEDISYIAVLNRYGKGSAAHGVMKGFGLKRGAAATTVSHDSHNLTLIYKDPEMAAFLGNLLIDCGGGIAAGVSRDDYKIVELPIGGLMSPLSAEELTPGIKAVEEALSGISGGRIQSLLNTAVLTLPVIPEIRVTDAGIVDVIKQEFIPLYPGQ